MDLFLIKRRHDKLDFHYQSQSYFDVPKRTLRVFDNKNFLPNETFRDIDKVYRDVSGYDMCY